MAVAKTVEIIASSTESIEAAGRDGIAKAGETIKNIESAWIQAPRPSSGTMRSPSGGSRSESRASSLEGASPPDTGSLINGT